MKRWGILTGEYPPQAGGVSDHTKLIAEALVAAGDSVDVIAPQVAHEPAAAIEEVLPNLRIHRLAGGFSRRNFQRIEQILNSAGCERAFLQYVPHAFGWKAMNVPFARWVRSRLGAQMPVDVMFHEVVFPFSWFPPQYALLGQVTAYMARQISAAADRVFVSIPAWGELLQRLCPRLAEPIWLPVSSNVSAVADPADVAAVRNRYGCNVSVIGHFGTYGAHVIELLTPTLDRILTSDRDVHILLLGRGSDEYRERFVAKRPDKTDRVHALGEIPGESLAAGLRACDVLLQPYPDGISSRRGSAMAGFACGVPMISNLGSLSEAFWTRSGVAVACGPDPASIADLCLRLIADASLRGRYGAEGAALYNELFAVEHTISKLRNV